ncbi:hypothetical protein NDU88_005515 [Pleurodeles waltl]|uniref:Uncharacterized protein n=1 Tax=Pleurodeles waltl TaxID=8319 RepID=A0AAV7N4N0_PLEWA|nr:hypothetical protein NDU88_005515 [Pleurodeles waltl]
MPNAGKTRMASVKRRNTITGCGRGEAKERRNHQETEKRRNKKKCGQETVSRWLKRESCNPETVRRGNPEGNHSQDTELQWTREMEEGEDALEPATF